MRLQVRSRSNEVLLRRVINAYSQGPEVNPIHRPAHNPHQTYQAAPTPTHSKTAAYLHPTVVMVSDPSITCPLTVFPVSEAEVSLH
jgi:hypothetical protein